MNPRACLAALALAACAPGAVAAQDVGRFAPSQLVLAIAPRPGDGPLLAQRTIVREWGRSEDSVYVEKEIPGWRSEGGAMLLSAALPGAGQSYAEGGYRGAWFALAEIAGWTARLLLHHSADTVRDQAARYAGAPADSASAWSFQRWSHATHTSAADLEQLYAADPEAFYDLIASDPSLLAGWAGNSTANRDHFSELRDTSDRRLRGAHWAESVLWVNHVVSAVDAFRAAHSHNVRLGPALGLKIKSGWSRGGPELMAAIERRF